MGIENYFDKRVLMCPPEYFEIAFEINPYMNKQNQVNKKKACREWKHLYSIIRGLGLKVDVLTPVKGLPDLVFPADGGFVVPPSVASKTIILANFKYPERQKESKHYQRYFEKVGYKVEKLPKEISFEMNIQSTKNFYLMAFGQRNDMEGTEYVKKYLDKPAYIFELTSPWFYHLGCIFTALGDETALYYPGAFNKKDNSTIERLFKNKITLTKDEALDLCGNSIIVNDTIIINHHCSDRLKRQFANYGITPIVTHTEEFEKAGGSVGCMVFSSKRRLEV